MGSKVDWNLIQFILSIIKEDKDSLTHIFFLWEGSFSKDSLIMLSDCDKDYHSWINKKDRKRLSIGGGQITDDGGKLRTRNVFHLILGYFVRDILKHFHLKTFSRRFSHNRSLFFPFFLFSYVSIQFFNFITNNLL